MIRRNMSSADIGRWAAAAIVILFIFFLSVRSYASSTLETIESQVGNKLEEITGRVRLNHSLTKSDYKELVTYLSETGASFEVDMSIGHLKYADPGMEEGADPFFDMIYTNAIADELDAYGLISLEKGDTFTVTARRRNKSVAERLTDIFISTRIRKTAFSSGVVIGK